MQKIIFLNFNEVVNTAGGNYFRHGGLSCTFLTVLYIYTFLPVKPWQWTLMAIYFVKKIIKMLASTNSTLVVTFH